MSIHRSLCIPLPLRRLSQRISRISTHSSGALYPGFSPTTLGPTISSGTHRYAVASPSEVVGSGAGAVPARSSRPGVTPRTGQRSPGHWVANEPGTRGDMTGHRVDGPQPRRHRPPSSLPAAPAVSPCRTVPRIVLWRSPESPLGILEGVSCHRVRILRRSVVVATKVPNPGQRLPNSRPILPTGVLPLALV
jgi:hypothetical protein